MGFRVQKRKRETGAGTQFAVLQVWYDVCRVFRVTWFTLELAAKWLFFNVGRPGQGPRLVREYFEDCGGGFVKIGQLLAMRMDLLPEAYYQELAKLFDCVKPVSQEDIVAILDAELRRPLEESFASFQFKPKASASIAQVHFAKLRNGDEVAVKIKRPGIDREMRADLRYLKFLARIVDRTGVTGSFDAMGIYQELRRLTLRELNFRREAIHTQHFHDLLAQDSIDHCAPYVCFEFSTEKVITMQRLQGVPVKALEKAVRNQEEDGGAQLREWAKRGITPDRTARILARSIVEQILHHRVYHVDPHQANLIVLEGGTLGFVDFGMVGQIDEDTAHRTARVYAGLAHGDIHGTYLGFLGAAEYIPDVDISRLETELKQIVGDWIILASSPNATPEEKSNGRFLINMVNAMRRRHFIFRWEIVSMFRTVWVSDSLAYSLKPDLNPAEVLQDFFRDERERQLGERMGEQARRDALMSLLDSVTSVPDMVGNLREMLRRSAQWPRMTDRPMGGLIRTFALYFIALRRGTWMLAGVALALGWAHRNGWLVSMPTAFQTFVGYYWWLIAGVAALLALSGKGITVKMEREARD